MAKDFSFPFYVDNWLGGTIYMTYEEKGVYLELLLLQFNHGKFTEAQARHILHKSFKIFAKIKGKFETDGKYFWNKKMEEVKNEREAYIQRQRERGALGGRPKVNPEVKPEVNPPLKPEVKPDKTPLPLPLPLKENKQELSVKNENIFDCFRKIYPGTKRGCKCEFENFTKHKDYLEVLPQLETIIKKQIAYKNRLVASGRFAPEWKHLKTWINNRWWEVEIPEEAKETPEESKKRKEDEWMARF